MATLHSTKPILYEVQEACKQLSLDVPTDAFGALDKTTLMMSSVANLAGIMVSDAFEWEFLQGVATITGDGVAKEFPIPAGLSFVVDNTGWSTAIRRPVSVLNPQQWASISAWLSQSFYVNPACRIYQDKFQFLSPPALNDTITFQYRSKFWVQDGLVPTTLKEMVEQNSDTPRFDWLLMILAIKVKYLEFKGMATVGAQSDFNDRLQQLTGKNQMAPVLYLSGPSLGNFRYLDLNNVPDTGIGR